MKIDSLVRAIEAADFSVFRDIALLCLAKRGYEPSLTDGPHDGGADFRVYVSPQSAARFAVQISVAGDWRKKLLEVAEKAHKLLNVDTFMFISSRRVPEAELDEVADDLRSRLGVKVDRMDAQSIASLAERRAFSNEILRKLGIDVPPPAPKPFQRTDLRQNVTYACAFFGTDAQEFRRTVVENAILAAVFQEGGTAERDRVVERTALSLGLASTQRAQLTSAIDKMRQEGRLTGKNGTVGLDAAAMDTWSSVHALQERERAALTEQMIALLAPHVKDIAKRTDAVAALIDDLGALSLKAGRSTSAALDMDEAPQVAQEPLRQHLRHLAATLDTLGVIDKATRGEVLSGLASLATSSSFGRALGAGEVFINLTSMKTPHLFHALGEGRSLEVLLDTPVAMPLLCSLLYEPTRQGLFVAAQHVYDQLVGHEIPMVLPRDYLEEIASHLLDALSYEAIIDLDPDLRHSQNAFVAHYVALRAAVPEAMGSFATYLEGFGAAATTARGPYAREMLMGKLQGSFRLYNIEVRVLSAGKDAARRAEEGLAYAMRERNDLQRSEIVLRHDATTLGWLIERAASSRVAHVLCTWDRLHPLARSQEKGNWDVLDPATLGDVLSLAAPGSEDVTLASPVVVARSLTAEVETRGAAVWDALVAIEKDGLHDARLQTAARDFKQDWMAKAEKGTRVRSLQESWEAWKVNHVVEPQNEAAAKKAKEAKRAARAARKVGERAAKG
ncbi:hypothetical protein [Chondromyces apiculatus]|uniref:Restriction endonuclease type IV Mrr domain-containing protein n=1 Tax=Chondromyces apiculatus DSM 436 TaxID=1192034 RepID=A0A017SU88_9BACT|nr:hypothetical protein [Chondromyces apiculatus]EYF00165.1 Hypothetical protein CAP_1126 [Chondromyces apiculatus DSM 436]